MLTTTRSQPSNTTMQHESSRSSDISKPDTLTRDPESQTHLAPTAEDPHRNPAAVRAAYEKTNYWNFITKPKYWPWWGLLIILAVLTILMTIYHDQIVDWLTPVSERIRSLSWGWLIPILILIGLSFPPLFGHEIVIVLCGAVYKLWIGFGIVAAGTFIGEICTYWAFKTVLRHRAERLEHKNLDYGALARMTREGGFWIVFIVRLSIIPGHFTTAVFATCGLGFWAFAIASFVTLPKQLVIVYLGVIIADPGGGKLVSNILLGVTALITILAGVYIWWKLMRVRKEMIREAEGELEHEGILDERTVGAQNQQYVDQQRDQLEMVAAEEEMRREQDEERKEREMRNEREREREAHHH